jgi:hypothetical protein
MPVVVLRRRSIEAIDSSGYGSMLTGSRGVIGAPCWPRLAWRP